MGIGGTHLAGATKRKSLAQREKDVCDASKEMKEIVNQLVTTLGNEHRREQERERSFSIKDLTVPLVFFVPMLISLVTAFFPINSAINKYVKQVDDRMTRIEASLDRLSEIAKFNTGDRFRRTDMYVTCLTWQTANPTLKLECQHIANVGVSQPAPVIPPSPPNKITRD